MPFHKMLYALLTLTLIQFIAIQAEETFTYRSPKDALFDTYQYELRQISVKYCKMAKNFGKKILQDELLKQETLSQTLKEFQRNISEFVDKHDSYMRYELYLILTDLFTNTTSNYLNTPEENLDDDGRLIKQLLKKLNYEKVDNEGENDFRKLLMNQFDENFKDYKSKLRPQELAQDHLILDWYVDLQSCKGFKCYHDAFYKLNDLCSTPKELLYGYVGDKITQILVDYNDKALKISKRLLNDDSLQQTNTSLIRDFKKNLASYRYQYNVNYNLDKLFTIAQFYSNTTSRYYEIPEDLLHRDEKIIVMLLRKFGSEQLEIDFRNKTNQFVQQEFYAKFEEFKSQLSAADLAKEKKLMDWFETLKTLSNHEERHKAFDQLYDI